MGVEDDLRALVRALQEVGVRVSDGETPLDGFPLVLNLPSGPSITLDATDPGTLSLFDPASIGMAVIDPSGYPRIRWGLAERLEIFECLEGILETPVGSIFESALRGEPKSIYFEGQRFYSVGVTQALGPEVLLMVVDASEEKEVRSSASRNARAASALKRIGRELTGRQNLRGLSVTAAQVITQATELAATLLWVREGANEPMKLVANVGANRSGTALLVELDTVNGNSCVAEIAACTLQTLVLEDVESSPLTEGLEGSFCYLPAGGLMAIPLMDSDELIGVLELVGRASDEHFVANKDLFTTIGEHLSLALTNAIMFETVQRLAAYDALTGIANHRTMQEFLHKRVSESSRTEENIGVVMLDVDHFRSFNEEEGHDAGDQVLKMVAKVLSENLRSYDMAARYGGEEFTLILPASDYNKTHEIAERVRKSIARLTYITRAGRPRHVTASLGCAIFPKCAQDSTGLLKAADTALFKAKREGRNRTVMYDGQPLDVKAKAEEDLSRILQMVPQQDIKQANDFSLAAAPYIQHLSVQLHLSHEQTTILKACSILAPTYFRLSNEETDELEAFDQQADLRSITPSLAGMLERFDGDGPKGSAGPHIPLLGRIMAVLEALILERGAPIHQDSGRFDPEILEAIEDFSDAA